MMRTIDFMKNTHSTRPIMIRMILIAKCFYKENHNIPFIDSPSWLYFRKRKTHLLDGVFYAKTQLFFRQSVKYTSRRSQEKIKQKVVEYFSD